ncbi:MAG TPA: YihY/virulence factor BrkB family protein [Microbacteriaceae bacterium]|nr:YihY/virulence factor BrkB family protein [Microbacteriaceae bacterium]
MASRVWHSLPARVWRRVIDSNGLLLSAGVSYQALFATFAAVYIGLVTVGSWFVADESRLGPLVDTLNTTVPGLIGDGGAISRDQLIALTQQRVAELGLSGVLALGVLLWTASAWITTSRLAIRAVLGLPESDSSLVWTRIRDVIAALAFGAMFVAGAVVTTASTRLFGALLGWLGVTDDLGLGGLVTQALGLGVVFVIDTVVLAVMFRRLSGAELGVRDVAGGVLLGGATLTGLQVVGSNVIVGGIPNPLLASFVVLVTLLLWFRLAAIVTLTAAAWIAEHAIDEGTPLPERVRPARDGSRTAR